jgi:hypothetical protein
MVLPSDLAEGVRNASGNGGSGGAVTEKKSQCGGDTDSHNGNLQTNDSKQFSGSH